MGIINDNFMLKNETAKKLYFEYAKDMPIIDYHCHISPKMIAEDYRFKNAFELFLGATITSGVKCARTGWTKGTSRATPTIMKSG